jgi:hypothetical protein
MNKFKYVRGPNIQERNVVPFEAKVRALDLIATQKKTAKEALAVIAKEFNLESMKTSWTRYAGSTISRFRTEVNRKAVQ